MPFFPKLSRIEFTILDLLRGGEMYGLEMVKASSTLKRGTIYVTLDRMSDKGLVRSRTVSEPTQSGMPRRLYAISGLGQKVLAAQDAANAAFEGVPA
ncbi:PadR family transcriptional regulator [Nitratireductor aquimarinus]|uniref:PadR family transcriptional regulator n=1 Tax=Nitratireductor TaxID=245876 RepID=UPI001A8D83C5|nr:MULTISPECIES: PadR family transcriptional regulator [Nitratireductor]MBN8245116.1 PadR family transcriptional regulator [Nitratireductor aquimarinus]MBY6133501.1 PadR family transcriptional regulator [Nitratireductor aquimarinus]MCA1304848.1 PadR family transcriptional regulator [Nitratireductor aquimarinus]MCV0350228.1 PadR family transcriptional regulator [Nitratireductor sp.]